jgi:hypothetical protein
MTQRTSIFATPAESKRLDVSDFAPTESARPSPRPEDIDAVSTRSCFKSREAPAAPEVDRHQTRRRPMIYRTGRNVTFSAKTAQQTVDQFYALAEENGWKAGGAFEKAAAARRRECGGKD